MGKGLEEDDFPQGDREAGDKCRKRHLTSSVIRECNQITPTMWDHLTAANLKQSENRKEKTCTHKKKLETPNTARRKGCEG